MNRLSILALIVVSLLFTAAVLPARNAIAQQRGQQPSEVERVQAASQALIQAISARDIRAMEQIWAHEPYVTFMGPLSTSIVVGWEGVRKAWEMRFNQFARVQVSLEDSHVHTKHNFAWAVGVEKVQLQRKNGESLNFDAFVTNVFEKRGSRWLLVSHQATPIFREAK
jgi:ketosteroid isomerase-like protein